MAKSVSIVEARRDLGRLADEVRRTGQAVMLTRRGRPIARLAPNSNVPPVPRQRADALATLRGTVELRCGPRALLRAIRELRHEFARSSERGALAFEGPGPRRRD